MLKLAQKCLGSTPLAWQFNTPAPVTLMSNEAYRSDSVSVSVSVKHHNEHLDRTTTLPVFC